MSKSVVDSVNPDRASFDVSNGVWFALLAVIDDAEEKIEGFDLQLWQLNDGHGPTNNDEVMKLVGIMRRCAYDERGDMSVRKMAGIFADWLLDCEGSFEIF